MVAFKYDVQCYQTPPFWQSPQLKIKEHLQQLFSLPDSDPETAEMVEVEEVEGALDSDNIPGSSGISSDNESDDEAHEAAIDKFESNFKEAVGVFCAQHQKGNKRFLKSFMDSHQKIEVLVEELRSLKQQRTMPRTWYHYKHPSTMYYK